MLGPRGELIEISSNRIEGNCDSRERTEARRQLRENMLKVFTGMCEDGSCVVHTQLQRHPSPGSEEFYQQLFRSPDKTKIFGLFGLAQGDVVMLVSFEAPAELTHTLLDLAEVLDRVEWLNPPAPAPIKSFNWRFWQ